MNTYRKTYVLIGIFFVGLLALLGLEYTGVRTDRERRLSESRILPELVDTPEASIRKLVIERGKERLVFERRGSSIGRWQMIEPVGAAAEPSRLETLVRNLKQLRQSPDSGRITGPAASFGLDPPAATVRLWDDRTGGPAQTDPPIATLAFGKVARGVRFVRPEGTGAIEVADAKLLNAVDLPASDWREPVVMGVPTFQVAAVTIKRPGHLIRAERGRRGRWRLSAPVPVPADSNKIESLIAALSSLRVVDGPKGYVADNVQDFTPFGLSPPVATVELTTIRGSEQPLVLHVGKPVPGRADRVYVRQGDQDDVVIVDAKAVAEVPQTAVALRSQKVADIDPGAVTAIQFQTKDRAFALKKGSTDWELTAPRQEKADAMLVQSFLRRIESLETSEFLEPTKVRRPELAPPAMTIKIWQSSPAETGSSSEAAKPVLDLRIGRHDAVAKTLLAQLETDDVVLALPDNLLEVLPRNDLAFRDHTILTLNPADIRKLIVIRAGRTDELVPSEAGEPNRWRMKKPIAAPADTRSVTQAISVLANLRADDFITDAREPAKRFGLDQPLLEIAWESDRPYHLKVGAQVPRTAAYYATVENQPYVFTLRAETLKPFEAEFHDHVVMSFPLAKAERILLHWGWPKRTVAIRHRTPSAKGQPEWVDEPGTDARGIDLSSASALAQALSHLETIRFAQYGGDIPPLTGLTRPRLVVEVSLGTDLPRRVLRIGDPIENGLVFAAEGSGRSGPVFLLPGMSWNALIQSGERFEPLPDKVFAPL
ncbi:MAG: DUF4340 domain-containing protein [Isosphaerales bacterium]